MSTKNKDTRNSGKLAAVTIREIIRHETALAYAEMLFNSKEYIKMNGID